MSKCVSRFVLCGVLIALFLGAPAATLAQQPPDAPSLDLVTAGHGKVRLTVTAGASGAPTGFTVSWMTAADFASSGGVWPEGPVARRYQAEFSGIATLHTWGSTERSFQLDPNESLDVEIGDLFDETGVSGATADELLDGVEYVFCVHANGGPQADPSALSVTLAEGTTPQGHNCTYTQGFWKTHPGDWPVASIVLGSASYTQAQLIQILDQSVAGNGLVSLAHQLIAAKLNIAYGADPTAASAAIASADALIGSLVAPPVGSGCLPTSEVGTLTQTLDDYNNGLIGPGHCPSVSARSTTWGQLKGLYR
jgi:hypothetical protein